MVTTDAKKPVVIDSAALYKKFGGQGIAANDKATGIANLKVATILVR